METSTIRTPGEVLGRASEYIAGHGTYAWNNKIYASVVGTEKLSHPSSSASSSEDKVKQNLQIWVFRRFEIAIFLWKN